MREYQLSWLIISMLSFKACDAAGVCSLPRQGSMHTNHLRLTVEFLQRISFDAVNHVTSGNTLLVEWNTHPFIFEQAVISILTLNAQMTFSLNGIWPKSTIKRLGIVF